MFQVFFGFEWRYWFRGWMMWIFLLVVGAIIFGAASSDQITVGNSIGNVHRNAPYVIQNFYSMMSVLCLLMTTAFVNAAAIRDFQYNTHNLIFSLPVRKTGYLLGRFFGSSLAALIPQMGVSLGVMAARFAPWADAERFGPIAWHAHINALLTIAIPNTLLIGAILFVVALYFRSTTISFLAALLFLVVYGVTQALTSDMKNEALAAMLDPFGISAYNLMTKYWTVAERNTRSLGWEGILLWNRLLWMTAGAILFSIGAYYVRLGEQVQRRRKKKDLPPADAEAGELPQSAPLPVRRPVWHPGLAWSQWLGTVRMEFQSLIKTPSFIVILSAALLNCIGSLIGSSGEMFGNKTFPVTYWVADIIRGTLYLFLVALLTYFAGQLVWKERDERVDEMQDSLPIPDWVLYAAKFFVLACAVFLIMGVAVVAGMAVQASRGYTRFQLDVYFLEILVRDYSSMLFLSVLAFAFHVVSPNKYVGYFGFLVFLMADNFGWQAIDIATRMLSFGSRPFIPYSDFFGFAPALEGWYWFTLYWGLFCALLAAASILFWPRGKELTWKQRVQVARVRLQSWLKPAVIAIGVAFLAVGGWIFYNTKVRNEIIGPKEVLRLQADYEKAYKKYEKIPQPRITRVRYDIDLYPATREMTLRSLQTVQNKSAGAIGEIHFSMSSDYEHEIELEDATLKVEDKRLHYRIYSLAKPMEPGEERTLRVTTKAVQKGFANGVERQQIVQNGTFFNNSVAPQIGYQAGGELSDRNERRKHGLPEKDVMPPRERNCGAPCGNAYTSTNSDWVMVETVMSTVPDQIAVGPGSLIREWTENGRRYFHYKLDRDSLNFYSFISARYEVVRDEWQGVKIEVYHHPDHRWNLDRMVESVKKTLEYCTTHFGPYFHKQARIIEFPRIARFAQAFPGTMPYSESIGFIADLRDPNNIDHVFYIVAHEIAHQWWAHQLIGANVQGATLLSETMAQYTALMVLEREYGRDMMRKFLEYEMDRYLRSRGAERLKERPLLTVESQQGYIHYNKGSIAVYYWKEVLGEEVVNRVLRKLIQEWAYKGPLYPTSYVWEDAMKAEATPDQLQIFADLFEKITLFSNRALTATARKTSNGKYEVTVEASIEKFRADDKGEETAVPVDDWVEVGAFAAPPEGQKYGKTLFRERIRVRGGTLKRSFLVDELPEKAGVDPFHLLIDRTPDDNIKDVEIQG